MPSSAGFTHFGHDEALSSQWCEHSITAHFSSCPLRSTTDIA